MANVGKLPFFWLKPIFNSCYPLAEANGNKQPEIFQILPSHLWGGTEKQG